MGFGTGVLVEAILTFFPAFASGYGVNHLVYWIGIIIGGVVAALLYDGIFTEKKAE